MKRKLTALLCTGILCAGILTTGCGGSVNGGSNSNNADSGSPDAAQESYDMMMEEAESDMAADDSMDLREGSGEAALNGSTASTVKSQNQKLIFTYHYSVETKEFDSFYEKISKKTEQIGGYVENSETDGSASDGINRYAALTLRIPADQMQQMLSLLDSDSNVTYQSRSSENVTLQYVDMESHLKALRIEQKTLLELMEKADKLEDVIALQSQLTQIRYEIESYESQLRMYDNLVEYSTLYLNITEVDRTTTIASSKTSFFEEISNKFSDNLYAVGQWLRAAAIWLISSLPILLPLAVAILIAALLIKKTPIRNRKRRNGFLPDDMPAPDTEKPDADDTTD
ncbi:MAG: DUF4349 domain-containing protein [Eubacterium sp.]|nr:DUF4349 domain-containing protein [Eubacterium sp.]